jgi:hypothetical protein
MVAGPAEKLYVRLYFMDRSSSILPKMAGAPDRASIVHFHKIINSKIKIFSVSEKLSAHQKNSLSPALFPLKLPFQLSFLPCF